MTAQRLPPCPEDVARHDRACAGYRFPGSEECERANLGAVSHPPIDPEELPCLEVGGVLVFAYLNHDVGAVQVSVDFDTADAEAGLVRPDGTVPLRVDVGDTVVLDDGTEGSLPCGRAG